MTVPFPDGQASLFLIRAYLYPFDELRDDRRATLARALAALSEAVTRYKGLDGRAIRITLGRLARR